MDIQVLQCYNYLKNHESLLLTFTVLQFNSTTDRQTDRQTELLLEVLADLKTRREREITSSNKVGHFIERG